MPFVSEAQRRLFHADPELRHLAKEWEEHTPKGEKLPERVGDSQRKVRQKRAFLEGFYETLVKVAALPAGVYPSTHREFSPEDYRRTSARIMEILRNPEIPKAQKNALIAQLEARPQQAIPSPQMLTGAALSPEGILAGQTTEISPTLKQLLNLAMLARLRMPPMLGLQARIRDMRRRPEEEWRSRWKQTPI